ncbi:MAG TPA: ATP-dependent DNA ligase [Thermoanaerobaculia bacterium]|nr:ATP-dependent DNA ligase [Thermoanaerobaculia bacterium]
MTLPISPPYPPMEALLVDAIPEGPGWQYEPKWDGFRCIAFRDGSSVDLQSKSGQPLGRYFPEVVETLLGMAARKFVLDGEIVVPVGDRFSFDDLLLRIHPAESRIRKLAKESPAALVVFDLLVDEEGRSLVGRPLKERRRKLEAFAKKHFKRAKRILLSPATRDAGRAKEWFRMVGGGLDGVVAKALDVDYRSGERSGMQKIKSLRTADCVVGGFRYGSRTREVGSLLLGLYDDAGKLHHVGFTSGLKGDRKALTKALEKLVKPPGFTGRAPGGPSRWSTERSGDWKPLAPRLVVEVRYDSFSGGRFRHGTKLLRWRPDKAPKQCTMKQVQTESRSASLLL